jgi:hypothetical protein
VEARGLKGVEDEKRRRLCYKDDKGESDKGENDEGEKL